MAYTTIDTSHGVTNEQWEASLFKYWLGSFPWLKLMGKSSSSVIQVKEDLIKQPGDAITVQIRAPLTGNGVTGDAQLKGQEESMVFYSQRILIDELRHGVVLKGKMSQQRVAFDLRNQAKEALTDWLKEKTTDDLITALSDVTAGRARSRYLYGAADSNWNATHATAMDAVDNTTDKLDTDIISVAKRKGQLDAAVKIRPWQIKQDGIVVQEKFIMFVHPLCGRDLKADTDWVNYNRDRIQAGMNDKVPMISGSEYIGEWDGVMVYTSERILTALDGASDIQTAHNLLMGAQAACLVWGSKTYWEEDIDDYKSKQGFAVGEVRGIEKLIFNGLDHGVVHVFTACVAD